MRRRSDRWHCTRTRSRSPIGRAAKPGAPDLVSAYPDGVDRLIRMSATTVSGSGGRLWLTPNADGGWTLNGTIGRVSADRWASRR